MQKRDIKNFTLNELQEEVKNLGAEKYRAAQLFDFLYKKGIEDFKDMLSLPTSFRDLLQKYFYISKIGLENLAKSNKNKLAARGIPTTIRISKGDDISAACGQLKSLHLK